MSRGADKLKFVWTEPLTMKEALQRLRKVTVDVQNIEMQLGDRRRESNPDYPTWRMKTKSARVYSLMELRALRDWIQERRRMLNAKEVGIWDHADPRALMQQAVIEGRKALKGESNSLDKVIAALDLFLTHNA